jgi:tungstate transport system substrate-binding protein
MRRILLIALLAVALAAIALPAAAMERLRLATTTSTENSGLLYALIPTFEKAQGVKVDVISVGTGKALKLGARCDVDVVMVHAPAREIKYVKDGFGVERTAVMHNFFAVVGPAADPAGVKKAKDVNAAFKNIAKAQAPFISRGDDSGTHTKERNLWKSAGVKTGFKGYKEAGQGMGAVLTMAGQLKGYTLTDTGTFLKYKSKGNLPLEILLMQDKLLKNPYHVMMVNPKKCPKVKVKLARAFIKYLVSPQGQKLIKDYKAGGKQLFWPDAIPNP